MGSSHNHSIKNYHTLHITAAIVIFVLSLFLINQLNESHIVFGLYFGNDIKISSADIASPVTKGQIAVTGDGNVYVVWVDKDTVYFISAQDNGTNVSKPIALSSNSTVASSPQIAATEKGDVYVVWVDKDNSTGHTNIVFRDSNNSGNDFVPRVYLSKNLKQDQTATLAQPQIAATEKGDVYVVWVDKKSESGDTDIQLSMSNNSGNDFKRKILRGGPLLSSSPQIAATEKGDVYVVWVDKKSERDKKNEKEIYSSKIMFRSSNDHGNTFDHAVRLSRNSNHTLNSPSVQATTTEDGSVYVVWSDSGLEFIEIVNRGSVFGKTLSIISNEMTVYSPQIIKSKDGNIYLLWIGQNNDKSKDTGLYVKKISKDYFDRNL